MALVTYNSPYAEVRAVVDNFDDPTTPSSTIRVWVIGLTFSVFMAFINQLFSIRQPAIHVGPTVAQLLAYPLGRAAAAWLPDWGLTVFGTRHSLNPGPFSKKEHMLVCLSALHAFSGGETSRLTSGARSPSCRASAAARPTPP